MDTFENGEPVEIEIRRSNRDCEEGASGRFGKRQSFWNRGEIGPGYVCELSSALKNKVWRSRKCEGSNHARAETKQRNLLMERSILGTALLVFSAVVAAGWALTILIDGFDSEINEDK
jgi:hypothetical protein